MSRLTPNKTAWVDKNLNRFFDAIVAVAPEGGIPEVEKQRGSKLVFAEYGCGSYGCVMPVRDARMVFKLTTDASEAAFVRAALHIGEFPVGIVEYHAIYQLEGTSHRKRPLFAIWRQEAHDVGYLTRHERSREYREAAAYMDNAQAAAKAVRQWAEHKGRFAASARDIERGVNLARENWDAIERPPYDYQYSPTNAATVPSLLSRRKGVDRAVLGVGFYDIALEAAEHNSPLVHTVGHAMRFYLDHAIVLADVHRNNIGMAYHEGYSDEPVPTITDPGHAVFLDSRYDALTIPVLRA
jgi:hypothetical protein